VSRFAGERVVRSHWFVLPMTVAQAFPLFEPEGERAWAQGWDPHYVYPPDGRTEVGMVFTTTHGSEETLWTVIRHDPAAGLIEYLRVTPGSRVANVLVQCASADAQRTRVTVVYTFTALSEAGNAYVRAMDEARYRAFIEGWEAAIAAAQAARPSVK
jgi:hypothetical protein